MYGCDADRRKEVLASLDRSSLVGTEDLATRQDPGNQGLVWSVRCPRCVAARKAWLENSPRVGVRKVWLWNLRHAEAQMGWQSCRYPCHRRGSAQTERLSAGS